MIYALKGIITEIHKESIVLDVHDVSYEILSSRPDDFHIGAEIKVYTHEVITEDDHYLVGFADKLEKEAFSSLIQVKGIGPKTALNALSAANPDELFKAISSNNTAYLKKLPGIGPKGNPKQYDEVRQVLKQMGFKAKNVDDVLASINMPGANNQAILKEALHRLSAKKE